MIIAENGKRDALGDSIAFLLWLCVKRKTYVINLKGITGSFATHPSTQTNNPAKTVPTTNNPQTLSSPQLNSVSAAVFKVKEIKMDATEMTSVKEPRKSIRASFCRGVSEE